MNRGLPLDFLIPFSFYTPKIGSDDSNVMCVWNKVCFIKGLNRVDTVIRKEGREYCDDRQCSTLPGRMPAAQGRLGESI